MDEEIKNISLYLIGILVVVSAIVGSIVILGNNGFLDFVNQQAATKVYSEAPEVVIEDGVDYVARINTNLGTIEFDLLEDAAPTTVNNFVFLAEDDYYKNVRFHRIVPEFIIQAGSRLTLDDNPANDGLGGPGYTFPDEINWETIEITDDQIASLEQQGFSSDSSVESVDFEQYTLAMANAGPNTNGSQFFITLSGLDNQSVAGLQGKHTVFGRIIAGEDVVNAIAAVDLENANSASPRPVEPVIIESVEIVRN